MKDSVIVEASSLWLVSAMDVSVNALLLALVAGAALKLTRIADPNIRHRVWTGILIAMLVMPVLSQILPSLRLPFAIDTSWLLAQQAPLVTEEQGRPQTPEAIQPELLAVDSVEMVSGSNRQMNELRFVVPNGDGSWPSSDRSLQSLSRRLSQPEHELDHATSPRSAESVADPASADPSIEASSQSKWMAPIVTAILPFSTSHAHCRKDLQE